MRTFGSVAELTAAAGEEVGAGAWRTVTQHSVDLFAEATGDHQWIHVDPERAKAGPFGTTIAHGFLTLSLLPVLMHEVFTVEGIRLAVNYGLNRVRFPSPVKVGARVRGVVAIKAVDDLGNGTVAATMTVTVQVEGSDKPACVAESIIRYIG